jgi:hypothetical protein
MASVGRIRPLRNKPGQKKTESYHIADVMLHVRSMTGVKSLQFRIVLVKVSQCLNEGGLMIKAPPVGMDRLCSKHEGTFRGDIMRLG